MAKPPSPSPSPYGQVGESQSQNDALSLERDEAVNGLRESEARFRALFASTADGYCVIEMRILPGQPLDYRFIEINEEFERQSTLTGALGKWMRELRPDHEESWFEIYRDVALTGEPVRFEHYGGALEQRWFDVYAFRIGPPENRQVAVFFSDITERKRREGWDRYVVALGDALRPLDDPVEVQRTAARLLGAELSASRVAYAEVTADGTVFTNNYHEARGMPHLPPQLSLSDFDPRRQEQYVAGHVVVIEDVLEQPAITTEQVAAFAGISVRASVSVPVVKAGRLVLVLSVHQSTPRAWSNADVALIQETAERTWSAVEVAKAQRAVRLSEQRYRYLFDSMDEGFCVVEVLFDSEGKAEDYRFLEVNPAFPALTGIDAGLGRTAREVVPGLEPHWFEIYGRVALTGEPIRFVEGSEAMGRWFDVNAFKVGGPDSRQVAILFNNVTAVKQNELLLASDLADARMLGELSARLIPEGDLQELFDEIVRIGMGILEADAGSLQLLPPGTEQLQLAATAGLPSEFRELIETVDVRSNTTCSAALAAGERCFFDWEGGPLAENLSPLREKHTAAGFAASQSTPLRSREGRDLGILATHWRTPYQPSERKLQLFDLLARQAADLIERNTAENDLRNANRLKDELLGMVSHEFRTPLTTITGNIDLLTRRFDQLTESDRQSTFADLRRDADRLRRLIENMLIVARSENAGESDLEPLLLQRSLPTLLANERKRDLSRRIVAEIPENLPPVLGNHGYIEQIVENLVTNSRKYGEPNTEIEVDAWAEGEHVMLRVSDRGPVLSAADVARFAEAFYRSDGTRNQSGGAGLGLAVCTLLAKVFGGTLNPSPRAGGGLHVTLTLSVAHVSQ